MLVATQGLVLHTIPYSESSLIVKVFSERLGVRSYMVKGVRKPSVRARGALLQPLSWLDMVVYDNPHTTLNYIKEYTPMALATDYDPVSNAIRFFMDELLYRTLREGVPMPDLFQYVVSLLTDISYKVTDENVDIFTTRQGGMEPISALSLQSLPIIFLLNVARHLGIAPLDNYSTAEPVFCIAEGRFTGGIATTDQTSTEGGQISRELSAALHSYLASVYSGEPTPHYPAKTRTSLIAMLIDYYKCHVSYFGDFKSHEILHGVLS